MERRLEWIGAEDPDQGDGHEGKGRTLRVFSESRHVARAIATTAQNSEPFCSCRGRTLTQLDLCSVTIFVPALGLDLRREPQPNER